MSQQRLNSCSFVVSLFVSQDGGICAVCPERGFTFGHLSVIWICVYDLDREFVLIHGQKREGCMVATHGCTSSVWGKVQMGESVPIHCQGYHGGYSSYAVQCMTSKKFDPRSLMVSP